MLINVILFCLAILAIPFALVYSITDFLTGTYIALVFFYMLFAPPVIGFLSYCIGFFKYLTHVSDFLAFLLYCISLLKALSFFRTCPIVKVSIGTKIAILFLYLLWVWLMLFLCCMSFDAPGSSDNLIYVLAVKIYFIFILVIPGILLFRILAK
ncbi:hypothetical protein EBR77_00190 [bacterium]|nr:hypothetical protein [bacterium]NBX78604.1 hypothetical protein [bacterium]